MSRLMHTQAMLLAMQLASVFKYVNDSGFHREAYRTFDQLISESGPKISFNYVEHSKKGRASVDVTLITEQNHFTFRQWFNYGILLELEIKYVDSKGDAQSLLSMLLDTDDTDNYSQGVLIDFEYAISIYTEHVSRILVKNG